MTGKLRFYCAACRKQCRDGHGFKQHCETPKHLAEMQAFSADPDKFLNLWSFEFERGFIEVVKARKNAGQPLNVKKVYSQLLSDSEATKISGTRWNKIDDFLREAESRNLLVLHGDELDLPEPVEVVKEERMVKRARLSETVVEKLVTPTAKIANAPPVHVKLKMMPLQKIEPVLPPHFQ